jgi:hypothetical protein
MPSLLESVDYESFSLKDWDSKPLSLDEALKKTETMRSSGAVGFFRIVPVDQNMTAFRVKVITPQEAHGRLLCKFHALRSKWLNLKP